MNIFCFLLQIGELFKGNPNRAGFYHLFMFFLMGGIIVGFAAFIVYKGFKKPKDK